MYCARNFSPIVSCALDTVVLGVPQVKIRDHRTVSEQLAPNSGCLSSIDYLSGSVATEVLLPKYAGQRIEAVADQVGARRN